MWKEPIPSNTGQILKEQDDNQLDDSNLSDADDEECQGIEEDDIDLEPMFLPGIAYSNIRPIGEGGFRTLLWNCNKGLRGKVEDAAILGRDSNADIFTINEPFALTADLTSQEKSRYRSQASSHGYEIHISKHQLLLIKDNFANTQNGPMYEAVEGRVMAQ